MRLLDEEGMNPHLCRTRSASETHWQGGATADARHGKERETPWIGGRSTMTNLTDLHPRYLEPGGSASASRTVCGSAIRSVNARLCWVCDPGTVSREVKRKQES